MQNPTLVVLTDRNDLDDQLFGQFQRCHDILGQTPVQAARREHFARAAGGGQRRRGLHDHPEVHARKRARRCPR
jgi:type I site-specific restriction-modification system R (restriction) subunit